MTHRFAFAFLLLCLLLPLTVFAQGTFKGHAAFTRHAADETQLADGSTLLQVDYSGISYFDKASSLLKSASTTCSGTYHMSAVGELVRATGHCYGVDVDGDTFLQTWFITGGEIQWSNFAGTGKLKGVWMTGTYTRTHQWENGNSIGTFEGSWEKK